MKVQVLVAAMNQNDHSLLKKMNINSDAIIGNQCDRNGIESFKYKGHDIMYLKIYCRNQLKICSQLKEYQFFSLLIF